MTAAANVVSNRLPNTATQPTTVLLFGNPNVGKTTLFNSLTGQTARVGNYPGITVERRAATLRLGAARVELVDAPGTYSLSCRSSEEQVALAAALGTQGNPKPSMIVVVVDAGQLTRNLYLVLQLLEFRLPLLIALTMLDEVPTRAPIPQKVSEIFGVPCVGINPRDRTGLDELKRAIEDSLSQPKRVGVSVPYSAQVRQFTDRIAAALPPGQATDVESQRALAMWALLSVHEDDELDVPEQLRAACHEAHQDALAAGTDLDLEIVRTRYQYLEQRIDDCYNQPDSSSERTDWTEKIDRVLLHPVYGFGIFVALMLAVFQALFSWSDPAISLVEGAVGYCQELASSQLPPGILADLIVQGVIGGVGNVVVFLPQILLLFFLVGLLEDSGYMARVAYLMDRVLRGVGLHGRAFVPMLSGLACAVPAILATRTMERRRDRILTMMVVPLMTCSARLPVYALVIGALFPPSDVFGLVPVQGLLMISMYLFSTLITLLAAYVLGRTVVRGKRVPLILELPRYRLPSWPSTLRMMWQRAKEFLTEAGTVILAFTIALWVLLSFPRSDSEPHPIDPSATTTAAAPEAASGTAAAASATAPEPTSTAPAIEESYGGRLGKTLEPVMRPLGFDWKLTVGIIGAFSAREVFISTMALVFGLGETDDEAVPLRNQMRAETRADGKPAYPPLVGLSLMVFFALACQCMSTVAVVKRETASWRWPALLVVYMTALAYLASLLVYQGGLLLGFQG